MITENIFIKQLKKHSLSFLFRLIKNIVFALLFFCLILIVIYITGNYQNFQDESQIIVLTALSYSSDILFLLSALAFLEIIFRFATKPDKIKSFALGIGLLLIMIFSIVCMSFSTIVEYISKGFFNV